LAQQQYDLIILDTIQMDEASIAICQKIRSLEQHACTPMLALCTFPNNAAQACLQAQVSVLAKKPISANALEQLLLTWIAHAYRG
jgi:CheY-like chemotaxis protein